MPGKLEVDVIHRERQKVVVHRSHSRRTLDLIYYSWRFGGGWGGGFEVQPEKYACKGMKIVHYNVSCRATKKKLLVVRKGVVVCVSMTDI